MKWSPPVDRLLGGLLALFAIGHRGPAGDDWTWETPKGAGKPPLGGPLLPLATAVAVGMMFGVAALASFDSNDSPSRLTVLEPSPTAEPSRSPAQRPTPAIVRGPDATSEPTPAATTTGPALETAVPAPEPASRPAAVRARGPATRPTPAPASVPPASVPTPGPTPAPTPGNGTTPPPTPVPTPTPAPVAAEEGTVTGGGQAGGGQFSIDVLRVGNGAVNGHFNYHSRELRIESAAVQSIAVMDGPCGAGTRAIVAGSGTVNGAADTSFQVTVDDCGEPGAYPSGGSDYLRVTAGPVSAEGRVSGNVQVGPAD